MSEGFNQTQLEQLSGVVKKQVQETIREEVRPIIREEVRPIIKEEIGPIIREEVRPLIREEVKEVVREEVRPVYRRLDDMQGQLDRIEENTKEDTDSLATDVVNNTQRIKVLEKQVGIPVK